MKQITLLLALIASLALTPLAPAAILPGNAIHPNLKLEYIVGQETNTLYWSNSIPGYKGPHGEGMAYVVSNYAASGRWEIHIAALGSIGSTNDLNRPTGTWHDVVSGQLQFNTRYATASPISPPSTAPSTAPNPLIVQLDSNRVLDGSDTNFFLRNIDHAIRGGLAAGSNALPSNIYFLSKHGVVADGTTNGVGTDNHAAIQRVLDQWTNGPVEIVYDLNGWACTSNTLRLGSRTVLRGLGGGGFMLSTNAGCYLLTMKNQNGNEYGHSNVVIRDFLFHGTSRSQPHEVAPWAADFDGNQIGPLDPAYPTSSQDAYLMCVWLAGVDGLTLDNVKIIDAKCFGLTLGGHVKNATVRRCESYWHDNLIGGEGNQDTLHMYGPWNNVFVDITGNGDDDRVALNTDENASATNAIFARMRGTNAVGSDNVVINSLVCNRSADGALCGGGIRILSMWPSGARAWITNLTIRSVSGEINGSTIIRGIVNSRYTGNTVKIKNLIISGLQCEGDDSGFVDLETVQAKFATIENSAQSETFPTPSTDTGLKWGDPYILSWAQCENLTLNNVRILTPAGTTNAVFYQIRDAADVNLTMNNCTFQGPGVRAWVQVGSSTASLLNLRAYGCLSTNKNIPLVVSDAGIVGDCISDLGPATVGDFDTSYWNLNAKSSGYIPSNTLYHVAAFVNKCKADGQWSNIYSAGVFVGCTNFGTALALLKYPHTNLFVATNSGLTSISSNGGTAGIRGNYNNWINTMIPLTNLAGFRSNFTMGVFCTTNDSVDNHFHSDIGSSKSVTGDTDRLAIVNGKNTAAPTASPFIALGNLYPVMNPLTNHGMICMSISNDMVQGWANGVSAGVASGWNGLGFIPGEYLRVMSGNGYHSTNIVGFWFVGAGGTNANAWMPQFATNVNNMMTNFNAKNF